MMPFGKSPREALWKWGGNGTSSSSSPRSQSKGLSPLLLHFDVNKTLIQSDKIQMKTIEEGIREGVAELFWGDTRRDGTRLVWEWAKGKPSSNCPVVRDDSDRLVNYSQYCKMAVKDKEQRKEMVTTFKCCNEEAKEEMEKLVQLTLKKMQLSSEVRFSPLAEEAGLTGATFMMFPTVFHLVAALQRSKRVFAILFRSFGADHEQIKMEWNAFCEMRHPVFSKLIQGVGPLDGTQPGVPDRRIHGLHTLYRDAQGPVLVINAFTNGPNNSWDKWAKEKPRASYDHRHGRDYIHKVLKAETAEGFPQIQQWMKQHLLQQRTAAIKDDWAWWQWNDEHAHAGKLLTVIGDEMKQLFYDDNIDHSNARIVDCRDLHGEAIPFELSVNKLCTKVNPVEAMLDDEYFLRKLQLCHGEHLDVGASVVSFQRQLTEVEDKKSQLERQTNILKSQLKNITEENRRMKLLHRVHVRDEVQLRDLLAQEFDTEQFGKDGHRSISDLFMELEQGHCWLEQGEVRDHMIRVFEMVFVKIQYKDKILIESHEQDSDSRIQTRNYLPGVRKTLEEETFHEALERWFETSLPVNLKSCISVDTLPVFTPDAPNQTTQATQAYPIPCKVQQSEAALTISEKALESCKSTLSKIGLPAGKHFTTTERELHGGTVTRFFRWDKVATWEATWAKGATTNGYVDIAQICERLFRGHPRREVYEHLLLQMFENFSAKKLCGGFSGSVVIRVQPFESFGRAGEPCIVKLDAGEAIREEYSNSVHVFEALPDRAARILGEAVYSTDRHDGEEFGAMRLELAGACWNVPELAQGSANLLSTFKDLLLYESEQILLGSTASTATAGDARVFGNVYSVVAETFGPGGIVSSLRKGGNKVRRETQKNLGSWYTLKGKNTSFNPYTERPRYPPEPTMRKLYKKYFNAEMPNLKERVEYIRPQLERLAECSKCELFPLVGLAHGDLNAANIMIDALDAVWLIDFATSVEMPLFTDMCKFEMACLFEYATIPITPKILVDFATTREDTWAALNLGDWIRVDQDVAESLLRELTRCTPDELANFDQSRLDALIKDVASKVQKSEQSQRQIVRALKARLTANEEEMDCAFKYCASISNALLQHDYIHQTLDVSVPQPEGSGNGALSLRFFMDISAAIRRFMKREILACMREVSQSSTGLEPCDALSLQLWLPFLRETYRIIGYRDIAPQHKVWSIYHCNLVANNVLRILDTLTSNIHDLGSLQIMKKLDRDLGSRDCPQKTFAGDPPLEQPLFCEADSHWIFQHKDLFPPNSHQDRIVRRAHAKCPLYSEKPGFFSPIYSILGEEDDTPWTLSFAQDTSGAAHPWTLHISDLDDGNDFKGLLDPSILECVGTVQPGAHEDAPPTVWLKSRLFFLTTALLRKKYAHIRVVSLVDQRPTMDDSFCFEEWSDGLFEKSSESLIQQRSFHELRRVNTFVHSIVVPESFTKFLTLHAVARDELGNEMMSCFVVLGGSALCYPPGSSLCLEDTVKSSLPEVVVMQLDESGFYHVRNAHDPTPESEREFEPSCGNHVFLTPCDYKVHQQIIVAEEPTCWVDARVLENPQDSTGYKHRLMVMNNVTRQAASWAAGGVAAGARYESQEGGSKVLLHLTPMCSGAAWLSAGNYEEEVRRMKVYFRVRNSFIVDALSGQRLDVKLLEKPSLEIINIGVNDPQTGAAPSPTASGMVRDMSPTFGQMNRAKSLSLSRSTTRKVSLVSYLEANHSFTSNRQDLAVITAAVDRYEKAMPSCLPNAFLVLGSPGSGKTALVCRLIMDCLERQGNLVPVLLPVADLVKRTCQDPDTINDMDSVMVHTWFDKYLRIVFGEDSQRYKMVRQAMCMHRVLFLFEGLEDCGALKQVVEHLIRDIVMDRHLVVVTSRTFPPGQSSLEGISEYMISMVLRQLTVDQQRSIAHARLGPEGLQSFDEFFMRPRAGQKVEDNEAWETAQEDVFGNPMMLSMLICYLQHDREKDRDKSEKDRDKNRDKDRDKDDNSISLTAVYRVAVDVMLQRVQSRQQADRHNKDEKMWQCKRILEKIAMAMQVHKRVEIEASDVEKFLPEQLLPGWEVMKAAVEAGHAMFLRSSSDGGKLELRFLVKGFQNFFAASEIDTDGGHYLPEIVPLLTNNWWAEMLEMLAEAWPIKYVTLIQNRLETFEPDRGNSFLHLAAQVGHRPVFQLLKLFSEANQAELWKRNFDNQMPLHVAAEKGNTSLCALMIKHKAPLDAEDSSERLPMHVALQYGNFSTGKYLLDRYTQLVKRPMTKTQIRRGKKEHAAGKIASRILGLDDQPPYTELEFKDAVDEAFVELHFFSKAEAVEKNREVAALMAVFWICANQYEQFIRGQALDTCLTKASWENLQEWTRWTVGLTNTTDTVGAMLVFVAIMSLGKIKQFRKAFAQDYDDHIEALADVLQNHPILIPSFSKLDDNLQRMILAALKADFNFGQFLQAENLPHSLFIVKEILGGGETSVQTLGFFLFRIFAAMCGLLGMQSLEGSLFMTDKMYNNFKVGLDALQYLTDESAQEVYNRFLAERARAQGLAFDANNMESRARVRLACLSRTFDIASGKEVSEAFETLTPTDRAALTDYLNADGITQKGFLLYNSPLFMENARRNPEIGLIPAMHMLLKAYHMVAEEFKDSESTVITVTMDELAEHARQCGNMEVFVFTKFEITRTGYKSDSQGKICLSPWQLMNDPDELERLTEDAENLMADILTKVARKPIFLKRMPCVFPELNYLAGKACDDVRLKQKTYGALLAVYWLVSNQAEAFTRGQMVDKRLSDKSWGIISGWTDSMLNEMDTLNTVFVTVVVCALGKIPKFRSQLAPQAKSHQDVMRHVLENCPTVLPSYMRLAEPCKKMVEECLTCDFNFDQFLNAENLPANLTTIKECSKKLSDQFLSLYLFCIFAEMSGSAAQDDIEGALYMNEERFTKFKVGMDAVRLLEEGKTEHEVYDELLEAQARACGLPFDGDPESRALVRLACLAQVTTPSDCVPVSEAFRTLDAKERMSLIQFLNADGMREKPAFILCNSQKFLESAQANPEVGLKPATRILLRVYSEAAKEFQGSDEAVVTIQLGKLTMSAQEFLGSVAFQDMPFELQRLNDSEALVIPKLWIPVTNEAVLYLLTKQSMELSSDLLRHKLTEDNFRSRIPRIFPELSYFHNSAAVQRDQTFGAMLAVYWLISGQYDAFIRGQAHGNQLSRRSWAWIQEWMVSTVKLSTEEAVDATLVFMAIHALGKISEFRGELVPGYDKHMHDVALAKILKEKPQVVPSFFRLSEKYRELIVDSLSVDFEFIQFLQAENTPANLVVVKEKLKPHGDDGFAFFCFRIFVQMCGKKGAQSSKGALFMDESQFQRFQPGLEALQQLRTLDAPAAYCAFLLQRGSEAMSRFASPEHQALARLLCLGAAYDVLGGQSVCDAFGELTPRGRGELTQWLNLDGISQTPGYTLCDAPGLLQNAKVNPSVGLPAALRMLQRVAGQCLAEPTTRHFPKVMVHLGELADWAKEAGPDHSEFQEARISLRSESLGEINVITVEVARPRRPSTNLAQTSDDEMGYALAVPTGLRVVKALVGLSLFFLGLALCVHFSGPVCASLRHAGLEGIPTVAMVGALICVLLLLLAICYYYGTEWDSFRYRPLDGDCKPEIASDVQFHNPREPFLGIFPWNLSPRGGRGLNDYAPLQQSDDEMV